MRKKRIKVRSEERGGMAPEKEGGALLYRAGEERKDTAFLEEKKGNLFSRKEGVAGVRSCLGGENHPTPSRDEKKPPIPPTDQRRSLSFPGEEKRESAGSSFF